MAIRAVLDTNVIVSGLLGKTGHPKRLFDGWLAGEFTMVTSLYLIEELRHVLAYPRLARRLNLTEAELTAVFAAIAERADIVAEVNPLPGITRDPKDDPVVACSVTGQADYIVSGDQDLLTLVEFEGVKIVTPQEFTSLLDELPN